VLMRKHGDRHYVGAINGTDELLTISIPAEFAEGATAIVDDDEVGLKEQELATDDDGKFELKLPPRGGAVVVGE
jgi:hypothetical protein